MAGQAQALARQAVESVRDDPLGRLQLLRALHGADHRRDPHWRYQRAATAFMRWQLRRGLLSATDASRPGSPWWRAVNETLLLATAEAHYLATTAPGPPSTSAAAAAWQFSAAPSASTWYRAHNLAIVSAYLEHRDLAEEENRLERFFLNLVLVRVMYTHALVAAPRLALGWWSGLGPLLGDPRLGMTGMFLSLSRVLPATYPLEGVLEDYIANEHGVGRLLDIGAIAPRVGSLYAWSADVLDVPELASLCQGGTPCYAWDADDSDGWTTAPSPAALILRTLLHPRSGSSGYSAG